MTGLRTTVNSFDLVDTLLARKCIDSQGIVSSVERAFGASGAAQESALMKQLRSRVVEQTTLSSPLRTAVRRILPRAAADVPQRRPPASPDARRQP